MTSAGFPHSETLGSQLVCQLPEDYRRLQRPSSAPSAKASTNVPLKTSATLQSQKPRQHVLDDHHTRANPYRRSSQSSLGKIQRCSRPLCSSQATDEPTQAIRTHQHRQAGWSAYDPVTRVLQKHPPPSRRRTGRLPQDPTVCLASPTTRTTTFLPALERAGVLAAATGQVTLRQCSTHEQPPQTRTAWAWPLPPAPPPRGAVRRPRCPGPGGDELLRKEVIQPHLPVRLPCYDLVPIASPTFDHSLPCGLGRELRVLPTFVT